MLLPRLDRIGLDCNNSIFHSFFLFMENHCQKKHVNSRNIIIMYYDSRRSASATNKTVNKGIIIVKQQHSPKPRVCSH